MTNKYTLDVLNNELARLLDARDILNSVGDSSESVNTKIKNIENSIETLESNRGLTVTDSEGGKLIINENGVTFTGKLTVTSVDAKTFVDMNKYKWDATDVVNISEILNKMWKKVKDENLSGKPRTKEDAMKYLKEHNEKAKPEHVITRLRYNDGKNYVQDFSFFTHPAYMSEDLLEALKNGQTLTDDLEKELSHYIIVKSV